MTILERHKLAQQLPDTRTLVDKVTADAWKPVPANPQNYIDKETEALAEHKREARLQKLPARERQLARLQEIRDRVPEQQQAAHPRLPQIEAILDGIASNTERTRQEYVLAEQVLAQHGRGMSNAVADEMFAQLEQQELNYRRSKMDSLKAAQEQLTEQQGALAKEIEALTQYQIDALAAATQEALANAGVEQ